jgi:hypothetical protein
LSRAAYPDCTIGVKAGKRGGRHLLAAFGRAKMVTTSRYFEAPRRLRAFVRAHETSLVVLAALVGTIGGLVVAAMSAAVEGLHVVLFNLQMGERLSSQTSIEPLRALLVPSLGGLVLGIAFLLLLRWRPVREIDPIETNALHGGRMSFRGSVISSSSGRRAAPDHEHPGSHCRFDGVEAESLVVVETGGEHRPVGILTEAHAMRRYAEESEQRRRGAVSDI